MKYTVVHTSAGNTTVKDPVKLEAAILTKKKGDYVVWSNDAGEVLYTERTLSRADDAQSCSGDYSSVVVKVREN